MMDQERVSWVLVVIIASIFWFAAGQWGQYTEWKAPPCVIPACPTNEKVVENITLNQCQNLFVESANRASVLSKELNKVVK